MKRMSIKIAVSAFALGVSTIGCTPEGAGIESASSTSEARAMKIAAKAAGKAAKALAKGQTEKAVEQAEIAVAAQPNDAGYRALLGNAYLAAGRFASAESALSDALTLNGADGRAALSLALAQTAQGDWAGARDSLEAHQAIIAPTDRGLAYALAGDPVLAVDILTNAARAPDADAKTRQNLALSLALAGRWQEAKVVASQDVAPQEVDKRIMAWAAFSQPKDAADQVASLLGVTPAYDPGQPTRLALVQSAPVALAAAEPVAASEPVVAEVVAVDPVVEVAAAPEPEPQTAAAVEAAQPVVEQALAMVETAAVVFLPRAEIVQAVPARAAQPVGAERSPVRTASFAAPEQNGGRYVVQIGAYDSAAVAEDGWNRAVRRHKVLAGYSPSSMTIGEGEDAGLVRVSVAGFASERDALKVCGRLKAGGGKCFVRMVAADAPVRWASVQRRVASR
ncbi:SPOR domain-containing protein [Sphingomonas gilva]|uniref:SPOR domain-containing protein n=1 Tax=Sphingomonas gilva TaxID=2305907 RepID=A0A396RTP0_9SPHN|nr:SPOR domain-containing protein [Sphingomonas gilva]RHW17031.1 SPOR domain-containing protein [Sphingomonas gilva]